MQTHAVCYGQVAKRQLMKASQGLVLKVVEPYSKQSLVPVDDLLMAGLHGLQTGVQKFDPARGARLSTVTYMWISEAVRSAFREMAAGIWIPGRAKADVGTPNACICCTPALSGSCQL